MTFKNRIGQIIKLLMTDSAQISLSMSLPRVKTTLFDLAGAASRALDPIRPTQFTDCFVTFSVINQVFEMNGSHIPILSTTLAPPENRLRALNNTKLGSMAFPPLGMW
jgi:hypothetical protein